MASTSNKTRELGVLAKFYLRSYNLIQVLGWSVILHLMIHYDSATSLSLWETVKPYVIVFQNAAALEIIHSATGLVPSNPLITTFQVLSRVVVVCAVILATPSTYAAASPGLPLALTAWSITEIIRYMYYFLNLIGYVPYFVTWLRYTTFIILYPVGVTGELLCFYAAQKYGGINPNAWSYLLPNAWNFTFNYRWFLLAVMLLYIPLFPQMYLHMFAQRRKILGPTTSMPKKIQ
ncbi:very-long-chain (3R)-3-hydroxyacyl-CoA dehydratase 2 [Orussus abietinus]|uniref:very-long-chain (3R)-3-hydroxyacyl-CoA dehydratase 2 n=1 Tax=Orussus abietinus TaxID=222816 RepID=UPI000626E035|nr:very-long-chain (3R)-3-hydroxyacyl-CoA dehydratase 2 [Orussus abietinus]